MHCTRRAGAHEHGRRHRPSLLQSRRIGLPYCRRAGQCRGGDRHVTHCLLWREAEVEWAPAGNGATTVTWRLRYVRGLDPTWYFGPWERYAAGLAADYLIQSVATP